FVWDWQAPTNFFKQFIAGAFIAIVMTGLDQDMMQKNLSCKNIGDAQKNMVTFSIILVFVNLIFLGFGVLMFQYIDAGALDTTSMGKSDEFFPALALSGNLGMATAVFFVLGLIAAAYSSADSALTALTTSVYVDFIQNPGLSEQKAKRLRRTIHVAVSAVLLIVIVLFERVADSSVIDQLLTVAGYTYGPILGMFIYCLLPTRKIVGFGGYIWLIALVSPVLSYLLEKVIPLWLPKYQMGYELLLVNGLICLGLLLILSRFTNSPRLQSQSK
ncbi:MAG: sodium:solute symporter, partial [Luteibaculum sp.]